MVRIFTFCSCAIYFCHLPPSSSLPQKRIRPRNAAVEAKLDGRWQPATVIEDKDAEGGIIIRWPDGSAQRISDRNAVRYSSRTVPSSGTEASKATQSSEKEEKRTVSGSARHLDARESELKAELRRVREMRKRAGSVGVAGNGGSGSVMEQVEYLQRRSAELREQQRQEEQRAREDAVVAQRIQRAEENELK